MVTSRKIQSKSDILRQNSVDTKSKADIVRRNLVDTIDDDVLPNSDNSDTSEGNY